MAGDGAAGTLKDRAAQLRMTAIDPMADTLRVLTNPKLVLAASVQINGIKSYGDDFLKSATDLDTAIRALP